MEHPSLSLSREHGATSLLLAVPGLGLTAQPSKPQALSQVPPFLNSPPPKKINPIFKLPAMLPRLLPNPSRGRQPRGCSLSPLRVQQRIRSIARPKGARKSRIPASHSRIYRQQAGGESKPLSSRPPPEQTPGTPVPPPFPSQPRVGVSSPLPGMIEDPFGNQCGKLPEKQVKEGEENETTSQPSPGKETRSLLAPAIC